MIGAFSISWNLEYDGFLLYFFLSSFPAHLSHIVNGVFDFLWCCEVLRYWRIKTIQTAQVVLWSHPFLNCISIVSSALNALQRGGMFFFLFFFFKGWMSYNTKYMVASVWLPTLPVLLSWLHIVLLCDNLDLNFHFMFVLFFSTNVVSLLTMQMWASKSFPLFAYKVWVIFKETSVHLDGERKQLVSEMQSPCLCICVNLCNVPMYIIL